MVELTKTTTGVTSRRQKRQRLTKRPADFLADQRHFAIKGLTRAYLRSKMRPAFGDWRSLVAHFVRDEGVGGSNPLSPTKFEKPAQRAGFFASATHEDENLRGQGGSTRAKRENVAPATARRASDEVASNPLSPTKFEKPAQRAGFFAFVAHEDENLRGGEVRLDVGLIRRASVASGNGTALIVGCGVNTLFDLHTTHFPAKIAPHISLSINGFVTETIVFFYICLNLFLRYL